MKIPVSNNTAMPIYVGAAMIPAGETRHFEEQDVPHHLRPVQEAAPVDEPVDPLVTLLESNVGDVVAALPELSRADVERLGELEQAGQARKGVLSGIAENLLARAEAGTGGNA